MKKLKIKLIVGYRRDQQYTIEAEEAHKAYYLFLNPNQRGVFSNGVALRGADIQSIEPDYNTTMGWNPTHVLDNDDWVEIRKENIDKKIQAYLTEGKNVAQLSPEKINEPLQISEPQSTSKKLQSGMNSIREIMKNE